MVQAILPADNRRVQIMSQNLKSYSQTPFWFVKQGLQKYIENEIQKLVKKSQMKNIYNVFWNVEKRQVCLEDKPQVRKWTFPNLAKAAAGWLFFPSPHPTPHPGMTLTA